MKMWDEVGVSPKVEHSWEHKLGTKYHQWMVDSDFVPKDELEEVDGVPTGVYSEQESIPEADRSHPHFEDAKAVGYYARSQMRENVHSMSDSEFEAYIDHLRSQRPEFKKFLRARQIMNSRREERSLWEESHEAKNDPQWFLSAQMYLKHRAQDCQEIEQHPHYSAGLKYARGSVLQHMIWNKPKTGRIIEHSSLKDKEVQNGGLRATFAGMVVGLDKSTSFNKSAVDWKQMAEDGYESLPDDKIGHQEFRFLSATLENPPRTVGSSPESLDKTQLYAKVWGMGRDIRMPNHHWPPGTPEYVSNEQGVTSTTPALHRSARKMSIPLPTLPQAVPGNARDSIETAGVLGTLENLIKGKPADDKPRVGSKYV